MRLCWKTIPPGERKGVIRSASQSFLMGKAHLPGRVFDARRDFGAKGNGFADDTAAIQKAIDAAAASREAIAYLPTGNYVITNTLRITGTNFFVGGSGWGSRMVWKGSEGGVMVEVRDALDVTLEDLMVGAHDAGTMNNSIDIHQVGSAKTTRTASDGVYVYGMYQKMPWRKGLQFDIRNYHGQISIGRYQFYQEPKLMRMKQEGREPVELILWASSWYGATPDPHLGSGEKSLSALLVREDMKRPGDLGSPQERLGTSRSLEARGPSLCGLPEINKGVTFEYGLREFDQNGAGIAGKKTVRSRTASHRERNRAGFP